MSTRFLVLGAFVALAVLSGNTPAAANEKNDLAQRVDLRVRVTGYLTKVNFKAGDMVKKGDVLFEIDDRAYRAQLDLTEAQLRAAEARVQLCEAHLKRAQNLFKQKAISAEELDKCAADRAIAEADRQAAQATRTLAQLNFQFTKVTAPINGTIGRALVTEGNLVRADDTLLATIESPGAKLPSPKDVKPSAKILELLKQRQNVLDGAAKSSLRMYQNGAVTISAVMDVQLAAMQASLDLCETDADRLDVLRNSVKLAMEFDKFVQSAHKSGIANSLAVSQAHALRLEIQIRLLREEEKAKANK